MKKNLLKLASALILFFAISSCAKDDDLGLDKTLNFSKLTVEQQKQKIESSGIDFVNSMDDMMNSKGMKALTSYTSISGNSNMAFVKSINQLQTDLTTPNSKVLSNLDRQLVSTLKNAEDIWGTYSWNSYIEDFQFTAGVTNTVIYLFPATENSKTNNAEFKIIYVNSNVEMPDAEPMQYMPSSISAVIKVDGTVAMKANLTATYKSDATPTSAKQTLEIDSYSWVANMSNNGSKGSVLYEFKNGATTLIKLEGNAEGALSVDKLEAAQAPEDILKNGVLKFQMMDIAFLGGISDMKGFSNAKNSLTPSSELDRANKEVALINKYFKVYGYFISEDRKFADVEFYVVPVQEGYYTSYEYQPRFVLSDGSKVAIETYMESGFEDLIDMISEYDI